MDLIALLCKMFETSEDELRKTMEKTNKVIESILKKKPCLASECRNENLYNISTGSTFNIIIITVVDCWFNQCAIVV